MARKVRLKRAPEWHEKPAFVALQAEWYKKLAADGFNDVERTDYALADGDYRGLVAARRTADTKARMVDGTAEVYRFAEQWVNTRRWRRRRDRLGMLFWALGIPLPANFPGRAGTRNSRKPLVREMLEELRNRGNAAATELMDELEDV